jgi:tetratricopeptide (TPR) repeat protein
VASTLGNLRVAARARILRVELEFFLGQPVDEAVRSAEVRSAAEDADASGDALSMALVREAEALYAWQAGRFTEAFEKTREGSTFARAANAPSLILAFEHGRLVDELIGMTPLDEVVASADAALRDGGDYGVARCRLLSLKAQAEAMLGRLEDARNDIDEAISDCIQLGLPFELAVARDTKSLIHECAGELPEAEQEARMSVRGAEASENGYVARWSQTGLARVLIRRGKLDEARKVLESKELNELLPIRQADRDALRAWIRAIDGDRTAIPEIARTVASLSDANARQKIELLLIAAEALSSLGEDETAAAHATEALRLAEAKHNVTSAAVARRLLAQLEPASR